MPPLTPPLPLYHNHYSKGSIVILILWLLLAPRCPRSSTRSTARWAPPSRCARSAPRTTRTSASSPADTSSATSASITGWTLGGPTARSAARRSRTQKPWSSTPLAAGTEYTFSGGLCVIDPYHYVMGVLNV